MPKPIKTYELNKDEISHNNQAFLWIKFKVPHSNLHGDQIQLVTSPIIRDVVATAGYGGFRHFGNMRLLRVHLGSTPKNAGKNQWTYFRHSYDRSTGISSQTFTYQGQRYESRQDLNS
jgi:hypothetical protein